MKPSEIRALAGTEIQKEIAARKKELMELRFQNAQGQIASTARLRGLRREIARLMTVANEKRGNA